MKDLMVPRYKVIADYPRNDFVIGLILELSINKDVHFLPFCTDAHGYYWYERSFDKYPHLFRKMDWWEERRREEMPEYVKCIKTPDQIHFPGDIIAVKWVHAFWGFGNKGLIIVSTNCFIPATKDEFLTPATLSEYLEQITNKK